MPKYNVELKFWEFVDNVEAENEQEAIKNALIKLTNNPEDFFTAPDEIANTILDNFENGKHIIKYIKNIVPYIQSDALGIV